MSVYPPDVRAEAVRLAGEIGVRSAARQLGVPHTTVYRWTHPDYEERMRALNRAAKQRRTGTCATCGAVTRLNDHRGRERYPNGASLYCVRCRAELKRVWTRERLVSAIHSYADKYGHPPGAQEWHPAMARAGGRPNLAERFYADGCWPHTSTVIEMFGSWNTAIREAGYTPLAPGRRRKEREPVWTRERIIDAIQRWAAEHGEPPRIDEWRSGAARLGYPSGGTVLSRFGRWNAAIEAAGYTPRLPGRTKSAA